MAALMVVTVISTGIGGIGGLAVAGVEGFVLGASLGLTLGVTAWILLLSVVANRRQRYLQNALVRIRKD